MKNVFKQLAISVLILLVLTVATLATDAAIQKKIHGSRTKALIISNEEMEDIMKIVQSFKETGLLIKGVSTKIENEVKEQKRGFLSMILGTLGTSLLNNLLAGKGVIRAGKGMIKAG